MIPGLKPYPAMKDSGVPWLEEVPEHWALSTVRRLFRSVSRKDIGGDEPKMSMSRHLGLVRSTQLGSRSSAQSTSLAYSVCHPHDLVMNKYQAHAGLFGCAVERGLITPNYTVFRPLDLANTSYYAELFRSSPYRIAFELESYGVGDGMAPLYTNVFYRVPAVVPPLAEQAAIVRFLDHADRRIRRYIRAKQKLIKLLEEQKQAIIHRAVTRGLDPKVRLKPSGVEWLGDVPEHWEVMPLCAVARPRKEADHAHRELLSVYLGRGVIRFSEVNEKRTNPTSEDLSKYQAVEPGDFVLNNQQAWRGSVGVSRYQGIVSPAYFVLALDGRLHVDFADRLLPGRAMVTQYLVSSKGVGSIQRNLYWPHLRRVTVLIPPTLEQVTIARFLDEATASLATTIEQARHEIDLLREYRTRLIADVVTGKLDVREAAERLPNEADAPELLDEPEVESDADEADAGDTDGAPEEAEA